MEERITEIDMEERITEIIDDNVNWIFAEIMYEKGIKSGDISFEHEYDINRLEEELAKVIAKAITELEERA